MRRCAVGQIHQHAVVRARVIYLAIHIVTSAEVVQAATDALVIPYKKELRQMRLCSLSESSTDDHIEVWLETFSQISFSRMPVWRGLRA